MELVGVVYGSYYEPYGLLLSNEYGFVNYVKEVVTICNQLKTKNDCSFVYRNFLELEYLFNFWFFFLDLYCDADMKGDEQKMMMMIRHLITQYPLVVYTYTFQSGNQF